MKKQKILFIINPISGGKKKNNFPKLIEQFLDKSQFEADSIFTQHVGHAIDLTQEAIQNDYDIIVAVGGDGTINEVAGQMIASDKILGIVPFGSGNGLARFLKIPLKPEKAIQLINTQQVKTIDTAELNGHRFVNMAGVGFDAHLSAVFAGNKGRGFSGYLKSGVKEIVTYKAKPYSIKIDGVEYQNDAFTVSIANSSQYGNNVYISPKSSLIDGLLDVCIIHPISFPKLLVLSYQMLTAKTHQSKLVTIIRGKHIEITRKEPAAIHLDGEPLQEGTKLNIQIVPLSLKVISSNNNL